MVVLEVQVLEVHQVLLEVQVLVVVEVLVVVVVVVAAVDRSLIVVDCNCLGR